MDWFDRVTASAASLPATDASIPLRGLIALSREVVSGYCILYGDGIITRILTDDMVGNINRLAHTLAQMEAPPPTTAAAPSTLPAAYGPSGPTLAHLLQWRARPDSPPPSPHDAGVYGARWVARTLRFVAILLRKLGADPALQISDAGRATYALTIAPFHAPVMAFVVGFVLRWAPRRQWVLDVPLKGASAETASAACAALSGLVGAVAEGVGAALAEAGLDYADKISAIPGGW